MTSTQKRVLLVLSILIGLTRLLAVARTPFDWDELLFSLGVADYDVTQHHPHPPGYPLFVAAAKLVHLLGVEEFRSLQVIAILGGMLVFPALFVLAREIGFDFSTSIAGAAIFAFLPNVWVYGGTGFSDVPATAIGVAACALLLQGRRDVRAYIAGAIVLGVAAGIRPPYLVIGAIPALLATWFRIRARNFIAVAVAILLGAAIVGASYYGAATASSSVEHYVEAVRVQSQYVRDVDSFRNPGRAPLPEVAKVFFLWPIQQRAQMSGLALFALVSLIAAIVKKRWAPLLTLAVFGPFAIMAWLGLDENTVSRYAISYMAMHALLAADGLRVIGRNARVQAVLATITVAVFAVWTWPALQTQRKTDAPPSAALSWIVRNVPPGSLVYVHGAFGPHAEYYLPDHRVTFFEDTGETSPLSGDTWIVDWRIAQGGMNFVRPRNALWQILRRRNFETSVSRASSIIRFGDGWYQTEGDGAEVFRWMSRDAHATLPSLHGNGRLSMKIYVPVDTIKPPPAIEVHVNGVLVERFAGNEAVIERSWIVPSRADAPNELRITTSATVNPSRVSDSTDTRELGLRINSLSWNPAR